MRRHVRKIDRQMRVMKADTRKREREADKRVAEAGKGVKEIQREARADKKVSRMMLVEAEAKAAKAMRQIEDDRDKLISRLLSDNCAALDDAYRQRDAAIAEAAAVEERRIVDKLAAESKLRKERAAHSSTLQSKLAKERAGHASVLEHVQDVHERKEARLRQQLQAKDEVIQGEHKENVER